MSPLSMMSLKKSTTLVMRLLQITNRTFQNAQKETKRLFWRGYVGLEILLCISVEPPISFKI